MDGDQGAEGGKGWEPPWGDPFPSVEMVRGAVGLPSFDASNWLQATLSTVNWP